MNPSLDAAIASADFNWGDAGQVQGPFSLLATKKSYRAMPELLKVRQNNPYCFGCAGDHLGIYGEEQAKLNRLCNALPNCGVTATIFIRCTPAARGQYIRHMMELKS